MSMFTRRNYKWLASVCRDIVKRPNTIDAVYAIADALEDESDLFDRKEFLKNVFANPINGDVSCPLQTSNKSLTKEASPMQSKHSKPFGNG